MDMATTAIGGSVGFGTAALGSQCYAVVLLALAAGFRTFDTAEAEWWYDAPAVGRALAAYAARTIGAACYRTTDTNTGNEERVCTNDDTTNAVAAAEQQQEFCRELRVSTKIPPWELTSAEHIRSQAKQSRDTLLGFCSNDAVAIPAAVVPLDVYYIHAPACWQGWHPKCDSNTPPALPLRESWMALEAVVGLDHSARRIGLSNVHPHELLDIIQFVHERQQQETSHHHDDDDTTVAPPRMPDAVQIFADPIQPAEEMRKICQEHNIEFVSYSTLGTQHRHTQQNPVLTSPIVQQLAAKHERSVAEVVLRWALQHNMSVIPRSTQAAHITELARLLDLDDTDDGGDRWFLDSEDMQQMDRLKNSV